MRVVSGRLRGRALKAPRGSSTRPTTDRVREALFSVLGDLEGVIVLDLYAGSGALAIEALSRGASRAVFVESARPALACIRDNLAQLGLEASTDVVADRVERARGRLLPLAPFELVLCDPPWHQLDRCLACLPRLLGGVVAAEATIVVEHPAKVPIPSLEPLAGQPFDVRIYGDTGLSLFIPLAGPAS